MASRRLIVGITGASGVIYGVRFLERLRQRGDTEIHLVMTDAAKVTLAHEVGTTPQSLAGAATVLHSVENMAASIASGSFRTAGMVVIPCSMKTLSAVAHCQGDNLLVRAADVCLKERRPLILVPRETPLHLGHLRAMAAAAEIGALIVPPMPGFYFRPKTIDDLIDHTIGKIFDLLGFDHQLFERWGEGRVARRPQGGD